MVQSICNSDGCLLGFMVFGHQGKEPFEAADAWAMLSETLAAILCATVTASRIPQIMALAEYARLARSQADLMVTLSKFVPTILFGAPPPAPAPTPDISASPARFTSGAGGWPTNSAVVSQHTTLWIRQHHI